MLSAYNEILAIKEKYEKLYLGIHPDVTGIGVAFKKVNGITSKHLSIVFGVANKLKYPGDVLPSMLEGYLTDVVEIAPLKNQITYPDYAIYTPVVGGICIAPDDDGIIPDPTKDTYVGTLGLVVAGTGTTSDVKYVLSNNHVLDAVVAGKLIYQPYEAKNATPIATFYKNHPTLDAAIAILSQSQSMCTLGELSDHTIIAPTADPTGGLPLDASSLNTTVFKVGATTGKTSGTIEDINYTTTVDGKTWTNLVRISPVDPSVPFSKGGDSGSLIFNDHTQGCALLLGGNGGNTTVGFPIVDVLTGLDVKIAN
jgi:hypothetical protein